MYLNFTELAYVHKIIDMDGDHYFYKVSYIMKQPNTEETVVDMYPRSKHDMLQLPLTDLDTRVETYRQTETGLIPVRGLYTINELPD